MKCTIPDRNKDDCYVTRIATKIYTKMSCSNISITLGGSAVSRTLKV